MNFDYYSTFKSHSNIELLKIVKRPKEYQKEAIDAANDLLKEREVSELEIEEVNNHFENLELKLQQRQQKVNEYKDKSQDFVDSLIKPNKKFDPSHWLKVVLLVFGLRYLWNIYIIVDYFIFFFGCTTCEFGYKEVVNIIVLIEGPIVLYLLLKRHRWGWIWLFASYIFLLSSNVGRVVNYFLLPRYFQVNIATPIFDLILYGLFLFFLAKKEILDFFGVDETIRKKTLIFAILFVMALFVITICSVVYY